LIVLDNYWSVVTGETIGNERGPVAVYSKLGWLVSGPLSDVMELSIHCNAIVASSGELPDGDDDMLSIMLRQFWDTEAIDVSTDSMQPGCFLILSTVL